MRSPFNRYILIIPALLLMWGCNDDLVPEWGNSPAPESDLSKFWYSRSRSAEENGIMMRHHALGFSYQAISGAKCNIGDVLCQVLNLDYLEENQLCAINDEKVTVDTSYVQRGIADYVHGTTWQTSVYADAVLYQGEKKTQHFLIETINDSTLILNNTLGLRTRERSISLSPLFGDDDMTVELSEHADKILSDNFRYALRKLEADRNNVAVIDSFLNIFGTHVVTRVAIGGTCNLSVKTSKRFVTTYLEEQEYSRDAVNLFFKKMETVENLTNQTSYKNLFKTAEIDLKIKGGDLSHFDRLIANPNFENAQASYANFAAWAKSLTQAADKNWDEGSELIDMGVTPIYEFIPDKDLALRVKVRMEASAQDMRDLYGDRNFTSAELTLPNSAHLAQWGVSFDYMPKPLTGYDNNSFRYGILHVIQDNTGVPSKVVAVTYLEYIPELESLEGLPEVYVTYPVYENRIQMTEGIAFLTDVTFYRVKWLYDRYELEEVEFYNSRPSLSMYLYKGRLFLEKPDIAGEEWRKTKIMPDYEWAGSINSKGSVSGNTDIYSVVKLLDKFYLKDNHSDIPNLPGWHYNMDFDLVPAHYYNELSGSDNFFWYSGVGEEGTVKRMVRNDNFRYSIIPAELQKL